MMGPFLMAGLTNGTRRITADPADVADLVTDLPESAAGKAAARMHALASTVRCQSSESARMNVYDVPLQDIQQAPNACQVRTSSLSLLLSATSLRRATHHTSSSCGK